MVNLRVDCETCGYTRQVCKEELIDILPGLFKGDVTDVWIKKSGELSPEKQTTDFLGDTCFRT